MAQRFAVILLVEDNADDIYFMKRALRRAQVLQPVRAVRDGEEAIQYLDGSGRYGDRRRHPLPCMVLLDFKLPKKNGLEVLRWVRRHPDLADLPVLMISSSGEKKDQVDAEREGVEAYRIKSVSFEELVDLAHEIREKAEEHCRDADPCPSDAADDENPSAR